MKKVRIIFSNRTIFQTVLLPYFYVLLWLFELLKGLAVYKGALQNTLLFDT